ncbi:MAG: hypothetical protein AAB864_01820, partial [Patescibacteria group bacterium]
KLNGDGKKDQAREMFARAYRMYTLFWSVRLKLINIKDLKQTTASEKPWTLKEIVEKLVDCCDE